VLGYPAAILSGWNGRDQFDASVTHLAKVRNILGYLDDLPKGDDDDLVLIIDGYDVILQMPPSVVLERYFEQAAAATARLHERLGGLADDLSRELFGKHGPPQQTVFLGPDKTCWPGDARRPGCWAIPETNLPDGAFGTGEDYSHSQPKWLNSGTIMGPVAGVRAVFAATMRRIEEYHDPDYEFSESDQLYMSDVWGEQEYARSLLGLQLRNRTAGKELKVPGGPDDRMTPQIESFTKAELGMFIDYESVLFQTWAGYEAYQDLITYDGKGFTATATRNYNEEPGFEPYEIKLPRNVVPSITDLLREALRVSMDEAKDILAHTVLGTNLVTHHAYGMYHCTGTKGYLDELWGKIWFYPYTRSLLRSAVMRMRAGYALASQPIDGRTWLPARTIPSRRFLEPNTGTRGAGAWVDPEGEWLEWDSLCKEHEEVLFGGEAS